MKEYSKGRLDNVTHNCEIPGVYLNYRKLADLINACQKNKKSDDANHFEKINVSQPCVKNYW